jgi:hypothetical protein
MPHGSRHHCIARGSDTLCQAKTNGKVLQILWGRHHHRVGGSIEREDNSRFFRDGTLAPVVA